MSYSVSEGETPEKTQFPDHHPKFEEQVLNPFKTFAENVYCA